MSIREMGLPALKVLLALGLLIGTCVSAETLDDCNPPLPPVDSDMTQLRDEHRSMLIAALRLDDDSPHPICSLTVISTVDDKVLKERNEPWLGDESEWQLLLVDGEQPTRRELRKERRYPGPPPPPQFWSNYVRNIDFDSLIVAEETPEFIQFTGKHVAPVNVNEEKKEDMVSTVEVFVDPATARLQRFSLELDDAYRFSRLFSLVESRQEMSFVDGAELDFPRYETSTLDATVKVTFFKTSMDVEFEIQEIDCPEERQLPVCEAAE